MWDSLSFEWLADISFLHLMINSLDIWLSGEDTNYLQQNQKSAIQKG